MIKPKWVLKNGVITQEPSLFTKLVGLNSLNKLTYIHKKEVIGV